MLLISLLLLAVCMLGSLCVGAVQIPTWTILHILSVSDNSPQRLIILGMRMPRTIAAVLVGASLSLSGAALQGMTRNPLASSGILGINSGAALAIVITLCIHPDAPRWEYAISSLIGATLAFIFVFILASLSRSGLSTLNLSVGGVAVGAVLAALCSSIMLYKRQSIEEIRTWIVGSLSGCSWNVCLTLAPILAVGMIIILSLGYHLNILSLGTERATLLGQQTGRLRLAITVGALLLAGGSVAMAGPIGFVGLITPHMVRAVWGHDYRRVLPLSAIIGALLLLSSDIAARTVLAPVELPVGILTSLLGAPFFLYLAQRKVVER